MIPGEAIKFASDSVQSVKKTANGRGVALPVGLLTEGDSLFIHKCVNVILKICRLHGFDQKGYNPLTSIRRWEKSAAKCMNVMSFVKYKMAAFYSAAMSTPTEQQVAVPLPKMKVDGDVMDDNPSKLLGGKFSRWMDLVRKDCGVGAENLCLKRLVFESLVQTLLLAKKGMPRPDKEGAIKASMETFVQLTTPPKSNAEYSKVEFLLCALNKCDNIDTPDNLNWESVEHELRRTVVELFRGQTLSEADLIKPFVFSKSANYNNSRSDFGALGEIFLFQSGATSGLPVTNLILESDRVLEVPRVAGFEPPPSRRAHPMAMPRVDISGLQFSFATLYERIYREALVEAPFAVPVTLIEAFKYRTITKGPPLLYTALKPLQRKLWDVVHKNPCFTLIGETISEEYIQSRMGKSLKEHEVFKSVDYKNATNEIDARCSSIVADEISKQMKLSPELSALFQKSLVGHMIVPVDSKGRAQPHLAKQQLNGQLMGSVTSFPILCIVNAAICRWSLELGSLHKGYFAKKILLKEAKLCVNGDDAVMVSNPVVSEIWSRVSTFVGLAPSIGKVYDSRWFLNMNSMTFHYSVTPFDVVLKQRGAGEPDYLWEKFFRKSGCVNMGLLLGLTRSGGGVDEERDGTIGSRATDLIENCPDIWITERFDGIKGSGFFLREKVLTLFINDEVNNKELKNKFLPWFIPENMGGVGLPCVGKWQPKVEELKVCRKIYEHYQLPWQGKKVDWRLWQMAMKLHRPPTTFQYLRSAEIVCGSMTGKMPGCMETTEKFISYKDLTALSCVQVLIQSSHQQKYNLFNKGSKNGAYVEGLFQYWASQGWIVRKKTDFEPLSDIVNPLKAIQRLWHKARVDKIPYPEPFGRNCDKICGYDFPVVYDVHDQPIISQLSVDSSAIIPNVADLLLNDINSRGAITMGRNSHAVVRLSRST